MPSSLVLPSPSVYAVAHRRSGHAAKDPACPFLPASRPALCGPCAGIITHTRDTGPRRARGKGGMASTRCTPCLQHQCCDSPVRSARRQVAIGGALPLLVPGSESCRELEGRGGQESAPDDKPFRVLQVRVRAGDHEPVAAIFAQRPEKVKVRIGGSGALPCPLWRVQRHVGGGVRKVYFLHTIALQSQAGQVFCHSSCTYRCQNHRADSLQRRRLLARLRSRGRCTSVKSFLPFRGVGQK